MLTNAKAMIFAAGLGTRLKPFTDKHPKALAVVNGKTLLERTLSYLKGFGVREVVINVHHFADQIESFLLTHPNDGMNIIVSHEVDGPYETGGGLVFAADKLLGTGLPFVVMNVDMLTNLDLNGLYEYHRKITPMVTLAVTNRESSRQFLFNDEMRLVGWRNNKTGEYKWTDVPVKKYTAFSFSGIHVIDPIIFNFMPVSGTFSITETYLQLAKDHMIIGYDHTGDIILDVGKQEAILEAERIFE